MSDPDPTVTITLTRSEWGCLVQCVGAHLNKDAYRESRRAHGHNFMDVWRKIKRLLP